MNAIKSFLTLLGLGVVISIVLVVLFLGPKISKLDIKALPEYYKLIDTVLTTGDLSKGLIRKVKMEIPEGMNKKEAIQNALTIMDKIASKNAFVLINQTTLPRKSGLYTHIRSYCSPHIADTFLDYSQEFIGFMPCNISIIEEPNGDLYLYTMRMELIIDGGYTLDEEMLGLANKIRSGMYEILEKGAAGEV